MRPTARNRCAGVVKLPALQLDRNELDFGYVFVGGGPQKSEMQIAVINRSECDAIWSLELGVCLIPYGTAQVRVLVCYCC